MKRERERKKGGETNRKRKRGKDIDEKRDILI